MSLRNVVRGGLLIGAWLTPFLTQSGSGQEVGGLPDYRPVSGRVAVFGNFPRPGTEEPGPRAGVIATFGRFRVSKVVDVAELSPWYYGNRGLIVDGQVLGWWRSPTFEEFLARGTLSVVVEDYVKKGGVLIVSYPAVGEGEGDPIPAGASWAPKGFTLVRTCETAAEPRYEFSGDSPLGRYLERQLTGSRDKIVCGLGFAEADAWTPIAWVRATRVPVLIELSHGAGRILAFGEPLGVRSSDPDLDARREAIAEGFLRYIAAFGGVS